MIKLKDPKGFRNCIHIQNRHSLSDQSFLLAEEVLQLFLYEIVKHSRPAHTVGYIQDFKIPFNKRNLPKEES